jgi:hypothetical protein
MPAVEQVRSRSERVEVLRYDLPLHVFPKVFSQPMAEHVHDVTRQLTPIRRLEPLRFRLMARIIVGITRLFGLFGLFGLELRICGRGLVGRMSVRALCTRRGHGVVGEEIEQRLVSISRVSVERLLHEPLLQATHCN